MGGDSVRRGEKRMGVKPHHIDILLYTHKSRFATKEHIEGEVHMYILSQHLASIHVHMYSHQPEQCNCHL